MSKILQATSTLTDRYQTTIPEPIRDLLHLNKRDKITYTIEDNGKVLISRSTEDDPILGDFLNFLANDIKNNPSNIKSFSPTLVERAHDLTTDIEVDLDAPLSDEDE